MNHDYTKKEKTNGQTSLTSVEQHMLVIGLIVSRGQAQSQPDTSPWTDGKRSDVARSGEGVGFGAAFVM